jgi:hypothetical protein
MITINEERAMQLLEQVVLHRGEDYKYSKVPTPDGRDLICAYTELGEEGTWVPSCGVALALDKAGVPVEYLHRMDEINLTTHFGGALPGEGEWDAVLRDAGFETTEAASAVLREFQRSQDNYRPYHVALSYARRLYTDFGGEL